MDITFRRLESKGSPRSCKGRCNDKYACSTASMKEGLARNTNSGEQVQQGQSSEHSSDFRGCHIYTSRRISSTAAFELAEHCVDVLEGT